MSEPKRIEGNGRTVRQLLGGARFAIDFYQREYAWQERQVREFIDVSWQDETEWSSLHAKAVDTMERFYAALGERAREVL